MPAPFHQLSAPALAALLTTFPFTRAIAEVHMHHTWRPNHAGYSGLATIQSMADFHVRVNGWSDIAQHVSVAPDGSYWTGRNWNQPPASSVGRNGTARAGPFMFEIIGDFDVGNDRLDGAQRDAVLELIARVQHRFALPPESLRFHRQLGSPKTCPGTGVDYNTVLAEVRAKRASLWPTAPAPGIPAVPGRVEAPASAARALGSEVDAEPAEEWGAADHLGAAARDTPGSRALTRPAADAGERDVGAEDVPVFEIVVGLHGRGDVVLETRGVIFDRQYSKVAYTASWTFRARRD